ncbi:MAG TPA: helix-turn-helix domain-containing protein [Gammaproteobacteria bacterium]|nr:helix-turn-helix domain-containing protein [Gammaproteobacteria bacterium]
MRHLQPKQKSQAEKRIREIGLHVRAQRQALGWSQAALAERADWSRSRLIELENGKPIKGVSFGKLLDLLGILGLDVVLAGQSQVHAPHGPDELAAHRRNAIRVSGHTQLHLPALK